MADGFVKGAAKGKKGIVAATGGDFPNTQGVPKQQLAGMTHFYLAHMTSDGGSGGLLKFSTERANRFSEPMGEVIHGKIFFSMGEDETVDTR